MPSRTITIPLQSQEKAYLQQELNRLGEIQAQGMRQHQVIRGYTDAIMIQKGIEDRLPLNGNYKIVEDSLVVENAAFPIDLVPEIPTEPLVKLNRSQRRATMQAIRKETVEVDEPE